VGQIGRETYRVRHARKRLLDKKLLTHFAFDVWILRIQQILQGSTPTR
jgi:hypothetical protein